MNLLQGGDRLVLRHDMLFRDTDDCFTCVQVVFVDEFRSSMWCSACGCRMTRVYKHTNKVLRCTNVGCHRTALDRDLNGAISIGRTFWALVKAYELGVLELPRQLLRALHAEVRQDAQQWLILQRHCCDGQCVVAVHQFTFHLPVQDPSEA